MGKKKITLIGLILMVFTTIYGFANTTIAFDQMGYASIIWYILAALFFMLPSSLMFAEYGSAFKDAHGGFIRGWPSPSVNDSRSSVRLSGCRPGSSGWFQRLRESGFHFQRFLPAMMPRRVGTSWGSLLPR